MAAALIAVGGGILNAQPSQTLGLIECNMHVIHPISRAEGVAEVQGNIVVLCRNIPRIGGDPTRNRVKVNVSVSTNVNITNNRDFGAGEQITDAVLVINENNCDSPSATGGNFAPPVGTGCPGTSPTAQAPQFGLLAAQNRLEWLDVDLPVPGASISGIPVEDCSLGGCFPPVTTLRVTSLRANPSQLGVPDRPTFPSTQVTAFLSISGPMTIPVTNNVANVSVPILGMLSSWSGTALGPACVATETESLLTIREGFATAFKTTGEPIIVKSPGIWEAGYPAPGSNLGGGASQGTRVLVRFREAPAGVELSMRSLVRVVGNNPEFDVLELRAVEGADSAGAGGAIVVDDGFFPVELDGGFGQVVYEVTKSSPFLVQEIGIPILAHWPAGASPGAVLASVTLGPIATVTSSSPSEPEPRFIDNSGDPHPIFEVERCGGDLGVTLDSAPNTARPGRNLQFRALVSNDGPGAADGVVLDVSLPEGFSVRRAPSECSGSGSSWTCDLGVLMQGRTARVAFHGRVAADASEPQTAFAQVSSTALDPDPSNDSASLSVPLR